jgi:hypothetical protein
VAGKPNGRAIATFGFSSAIWVCTQSMRRVGFRLGTLIRKPRRSCIDTAKWSVASPRSRVHARAFGDLVDDFLVFSQCQTDDFGALRIMRSEGRPISGVMPA